MKKLLIILAIVGGLFVAWRLWLAAKAKRLDAIWPVKDDRTAAAASATQDSVALMATPSVIPPGAMNVRTTIGTIDANRIGGNITPETRLWNVQKWSPLGGSVVW